MNAMISHIIYHIPSMKKVGCTKNLKRRLNEYPSGIKYEVLEELHDKTDQEAGDIEWQWAVKFGYKRGQHYSRSGFMNVTTDQHRELSRKGYKNMNDGFTVEQRSVWRSKGANRVNELGLGGLVGLPIEEYIRRAKKGGRKGGLKGAKRVNELKKSGMFMIGECPHCGFETSIALLHRWHFRNCKFRPMRRGS